MYVCCAHAARREENQGGLCASSQRLEVLTSHVDHTPPRPIAGPPCAIVHSILHYSSLNSQCSPSAPPSRARRAPTAWWVLTGSPVRRVQSHSRFARSSGRLRCREERRQAACLHPAGSERQEGERQRRRQAQGDLLLPEGRHARLHAGSQGLQRRAAQAEEGRRRLRNLFRRCCITQVLLHGSRPELPAFGGC